MSNSIFIFVILLSIHGYLTVNVDQEEHIITLCTDDVFQWAQLSCDEGVIHIREAFFALTDEQCVDGQEPKNTECEKDVRTWYQCYECEFQPSCQLPIQPQRLDCDAKRSNVFHLTYICITEPMESILCSCGTNCTGDLGEDFDMMSWGDSSSSDSSDLSTSSADLSWSFDVSSTSTIESDWEGDETWNSLDEEFYNAIPLALAGSSKNSIAKYKTQAPTYIGYITSPNYPGPYPNKVKCKCEIETDPDALLYIEVLRFELEKRGPGCRTDYVEIKNNGVMRKICGSIPSGSMYSVGASMTTFVFGTDSSVGDEGFLLKYWGMDQSGALRPSKARCGTFRDMNRMDDEITTRAPNSDSGSNGNGDGNGEGSGTGGNGSGSGSGSGTVDVPKSGATGANTTDGPVGVPRSGPNTALIIGVVVGALLLILIVLIIIIIVCCCRRRKRQPTLAPTVVVVPTKGQEAQPIENHYNDPHASNGGLVSFDNAGYQTLERGGIIAGTNGKLQEAPPSYESLAGSGDRSAVTPPPPIIPVPATPVASAPLEEPTYQEVTAGTTEGVYSDVQGTPGGLTTFDNAGYEAVHDVIPGKPVDAPENDYDTITDSQPKAPPTDEPSYDKIADVGITAEPDYDTVN